MIYTKEKLARLASELCAKELLEKKEFTFTNSCYCCNCEVFDKLIYL